MLNFNTFYKKMKQIIREYVALVFLMKIKLWKKKIKITIGDFI